eukprot:746704-Hanusia_phi.AAC.7
MLCCCLLLTASVLSFTRFWRVALAAAELQAREGKEIGGGVPELCLEVLEEALRRLPLTNKLGRSRGGALDSSPPAAGGNDEG